MKNKVLFISIFTLCIALSLTACGVKQASTTDSKNTQTEAGSEASGKSDSRLDDLYQQENQIFADHEEVWNKVFGMMNKSTADPSGNYADYLADTVDSNKDSFSEDELKTLTDDIETIRKNRGTDRRAGKTTQQHLRMPMPKIIPKMHLHSGISPVRIMTATQLTKVCFPTMQ